MDPVIAEPPMVAVISEPDKLKGPTVPTAEVPAIPSLLSNVSVVA
jgi:hypothetical protein